MRLSWKVSLAIVLLAVVLIAWSQLPMASWIEQFRYWILKFGALGVVAFVVLYVVATVLLGPVTALTLSAGLAYGAWGFPLVVGSATLGALVAFLLGRYVARAGVSRWINQDSRLRALNKAFSEQGWRVMGLMRLSPIVPYGVQNYLFSVTQIGFVPYALATVFGIMPATALLVYIGSLGQSVGRVGVLQWVLMLAGLLATLAVGWVVGRQVRKVLADQPNDEVTESWQE